MAKRIVILTGVNRGIGRRTAELLLEKYSGGFHYIFTQRTGNHIELIEEFSKINQNASFELKTLEITNKNSRALFLSDITQKHKSVDVIVNNAAVFDHTSDKGVRPTRKTADHTLDVNFKSTVEFTEELYPLLSLDGRIVEISGFLGQLSYQPKNAQTILSDENLTRERLFQLCDDYINKCDDQNADLVFTKYAYHFSKALLNAYVRYVASKYIKPNQSVFTVDPGWVQTEMGGPNATKSVDQACPSLAAFIAEIPFGRHELSGKFISDNKLFDY